MFGSLGGPELILIFIVGLVVFGPRKLPEIGKSLGKMIGEFKRASADFQRTVEDEVETERLRKEITSADYPASPSSSASSASAPSTPAPSTPAPALAPQIREAEGSVPTSTLISSTADMSGDKFSGGGGESSSS